MFYGLGSGFLWAVQTVTLSVVLALGIFSQSAQAVFLAPFVGAFLNDALSGIWLSVFRKAFRLLRGVSALQALRSKHGRWLLLSGLCGGPLGMSAYVLSIKYVGASDTAVISALYPVIGAIIARVFLKERLTGKQLVGILLSAVGVVGMVGLPRGSGGPAAYYALALTCALFWGLEAVISSHGMKKGGVASEAALQLRQWTSVFCYAALFLPLLHAWGFTAQILTSKVILIFLLTALLETVSYLFYYRSISRIGPSKAMSLNITYIIWSLLLSIVLFGRVPTLFETLSIGVLLVGVLMVVKYEKENKSRRGL